MNPEDAPGMGATNELSLRVSVATLARVIFEHPADGTRMLALERRATVHSANDGQVVKVKSQPFGGAIRILDVMKLRELIGEFRFDNDRSHSEKDFRLFIKPSSWDAVRELCIQHFRGIENPILETDPGRELAEEFAGALKIGLEPGQYLLKPITTIVEDTPSPTENMQARGFPTARVYRIFEARVRDPSLAQAMLENSEGLSDQRLCELAWEDARHGGEGKANAVLTLPLKRLSDAYRDMSPQQLNAPVMFGKDWLDETVTTVLDDVTAPKYRRLSSTVT